MVVQVLEKLDMDKGCSVGRAFKAQTAIMTASYMLTYLGLRFRAPHFQPLLPPPPPQASQPLPKAEPASLRKRNRGKKGLPVSTPATPVRSGVTLTGGIKRASTVRGGWGRLW
jgi:hypothetical protein